MLIQRKVTKQYYDCAHYFLEVTQKQSCCKLDMSMKTPCLNTTELPHTFSIIRKELPSLLNTMCFNEDNLPFKEEVKHTEIGHLFEHIVLEYLCLNKLAAGSRKAVFNGRTSWNWVKETRGIFHIHIDVAEEDSKILTAALFQAELLMQKLLLAYKSN